MFFAFSSAADPPQTSGAVVTWGSGLSLREVFRPLFNDTCHVTFFDDRLIVPWALKGLGTIYPRWGASRGPW